MAMFSTTLRWACMFRRTGRRIGYVFQDARLFPHLDVSQNLDYGAA